MAFEFISRSNRLTNYAIIPNELFSMNLSSTALLVYAKLFNRANLSVANGKVDELGRIYVLYRQEELARELKRSVSTIKENLNELAKAGLIEKKRAVKGRANMIYVKVPDSSVTVEKSAVYEPKNKPLYSRKTNRYTAGFSAPNNKNNNRDINLTYKYGEDTF